MEDTLQILAIVAHPDDAELLMGGTLARAAAEGRRAGVLDLAAGESGSRGSAEVRRREAEEAAAILGLAHRENLGLPDARLEASVENRIRLAERIRALGPEVLLIHRAAGRNPDHHAASVLAREAAYTAGLAKVGKGGPARRPRKILEAVSFLGEKPNLVVDVSGAFETKLRALRAYASQFDGAFEAGDILSNGRDELLEQVTFRCRAYGALVQVPFGEPYLMYEPFLTGDLLALAGRSL